MEPYLVGSEVSDEASYLCYKFGPMVGFLLGFTGSGVGSAEGGSLRDSQGPYGCLS